MKSGKIILVVLASLLLAACGNENNDQPKLMKKQSDAMDKAKGVENTLKQQADEQNKQLDKQSQ